MSSGTPRFSLVPASYVYLRRGDEVLLQQRRNTGYMDGHWVAGAAGHVEPGELAIEAAVRETREELGVDVDREDLSLITVMQRTDGTDAAIEQRVDWMWQARAWEGDPRIAEPEKIAALDWFSLRDLPEPIPVYELRVLAAIGGAGIPVASGYGFDRVLR